MDRKRWKVNKLATEAKVAQSTLDSQFRRNAFSVDVLVKAAIALGVGLDWLVWGPEGETKDPPADKPEGDTSGVVPIADSERVVILELLDVVGAVVRRGLATEPAVTVEWRTGEATEAFLRRLEELTQKRQTG